MFWNWTISDFNPLCIILELVFLYASLECCVGWELGSESRQIRRFYKLATFKVLKNVCTWKLIYTINVGRSHFSNKTFAHHENEMLLWLLFQYLILAEKNTGSFSTPWYSPAQRALQAWRSTILLLPRIIVTLKKKERCYDDST